MKSNSRSYPASFRTLTIPNNRHIIALIISIRVFTCLALFACFCGRSTRSEVQIFAFDSLYFARLEILQPSPDRSARQTPGEVRPDFIVGALRKIRTPNRRSDISGICAICQRSAADQRKGSARTRTGPGVDSPRSVDRRRSEKQALKL